MTDTTLRLGRIVILTLYLLLAIGYSVITPPFEASDELWHYPMVKVLADNGLAIPVQVPGVETAWRQEGSQPPLYYMAAALLTGWIDTGDMDAVRRQNPHADIGVVHPDGNINMMIHPPDGYPFPWQGTILALQIARLFSIVLGAGTVWVTFALARALFPDRPAIILAAGALTAFLPMFLFIAGSVNNDNLSTFIGNLLTLLVVRLLRAETRPSISAYVLLGVTAGAGMLAKFNIGFMLPLIALALLLISIRLRTLQPLLVGGLISGGLTIAIAAWWYVRNLTLYGDPTGLNVFLDIVGRRAIPANLAQIWAERGSFMAAFWGFFGGVNVPMPDAVYAIFDAIALVGVGGGVLYCIVRVSRARVTTDALRRALPYVFTLLWIGINLLSYARWTSETPASQGRLMFGALSAIMIWLAVGLAAWLPRRVTAIVLVVAGVWFAGVAVAAPFAIIRPAYTLPEQAFITPDAPVLAEFTAPDGGSIALLRAEGVTPAAAPDEYVFLDLTWRVDAPFSRNWSVFVHLVTEDNVIIAQRDIYPGAGRLALSDLSAGRAWDERLAVRVPGNAYAPQNARIDLGWYHLPTGERMAGGVESIYTVGETQIIPRPGMSDVPNPSSIVFGGLIEMVGYSLSDLSPRAGESTTLTLYWRALAPIERDYIVFAHIIDPTSLAIYAGSDAQPAGWTRPTSSWSPGEIVEDTHVLTLHPDTPPVPGIYELEIGLYLNPGDGTFPRLRVFTPDGGMANDYAYLSRVRVLPRAESEDVR
jgi:4-amino-4-deoxy-L-arabinose transferase-like glycosyltransferase